MTASAAARRMSSGPGSSGKPWPRLMALLSRASCDIASKIVTGRSAKTLFMERHGSDQPPVLVGNPAAFQARHAARQMLVIGKARGLRGQRRRHRSFAGAAGKHHLLALGIGNILRVEARKRNDDAAGIGFHGDFVRLADVDQKIASLGHPLRDVFRRQIVHLMVRHSYPPNDPDTSEFGNADRSLALRRQRRLSRDENQAPEGSLRNA